MNRFLHLLWLAIAPSFLVFAESDFGFDWTSDDYEIIFADFDGDGNLDSLLLSNKSDLPSWFLNGVAGSSPTSHWQSFDKESEYLAPGDFDNDGKAELLVMQKDLSGRYLELNQDSELVEGEEKLKFSGYNKNRQIDFTHLIKGDFNGDNSDDLLAYAESNHDIVVFHNQQKSKKIKFKFDAQLTLENTSPLTPFTNDFNGDGLEDIVLISSEISGQSYVAFAGKKGRFKKSDFQDITPYLNGEEFNTNQHTIQMLKSADSESQIVRLTNAKGGYDEEGNWIENDDDITEGIPRTGNMTNSLSGSTCEDLAYAPLSNQLSIVCGNDINDAQNLKQSRFSSSSITNNPTSDDLTSGGFAQLSTEVADVAPGNPTSAPTVSGGSYHPVNAFYTVNVSPVANATYYQIYVGTSSSNVSPNKTGSSTSIRVWSGGNYGHKYIKYKACNADGCSSLSPYKRIFVYTSPGAPKNLSSNISAATLGQSVTLSWNDGGGQISSGNFEIYETVPGRSEQFIRTQSGNSYSPNLNDGFGTYTYRIKACNPGPMCGSSASKSISLNNRNPVADNESANVDEGKSVNINVLSGDSDPDGHGISISGNSNPSKGSVSCSGSYCNYTASNNISSNTSDSFTYTITDGHGGSATGTVSISIKNLLEGTVSTPTISPSGKTFTGSQSISISTSTSGATIYYTTNGTNPTTSSTRYTGAFSITNDTTVKAFAVKADYANSGIDTEVFDRNDAPAAPTGLTAEFVESNHSLYISWYAVSGATTYQAARSVNSGQTWNNSYYSGGATHFTDSDISNNDGKIYYRIRSCKGTECGDWTTSPVQ